MKKKSIFLILCLSLFVLSACSNNTNNKTFDIPDIEAFQEANNKYKPGQRIDFNQEGVIEELEQTLGKFYVKKGDKIYFWGKSIIEGADTDSFLPLGPEIAVDKNSIFMDGVKIKDADKESFQLFGNGTYYGIDKNNIYRSWKKIDSADRKSLNVLILRNPDSMDTSKTDIYLDYAIDKNNLYYREEKYPLPDFKIPIIIPIGDPILEKLERYVHNF